MSAPADWTVGKGGPFDIQVFAPDKSANSGLFVYRRNEFKAGSSLSRVLKLQVDDLRGKRQNFTVVVKPTVKKARDKTIASAVYAGEKDGSRFYYRFAAVEFQADKSTIVTALQVTLPAGWTKKRKTLEGITNSLTIE